MLVGYFDESGSPDESLAFVVAGFVASDDQWIQFDREWRGALADEGVSHFHMKEFPHSRGAFVSWKDDEARRERFLRILVDIIRRRVRRSFAEAVILEELHKVNDKYLFQEFVGNPYPLCARSCVAKANTWALGRGFAEPISYIFEDGAKHKGEFIAAMKRDEQRPPEFGTKDQYVAFQAADFVAWECLKVYTSVESNTFKRFRRSFEALSSIPNEWAV